MGAKIALSTKRPLIDCCCRFHSITKGKATPVQILSQKVTQENIHVRCHYLSCLLFQAKMLKKVIKTNQGFYRSPISCKFNCNKKSDFRSNVLSNCM